MSNKKSRTDLDGKTWARYSISIWSDIEKDIEEKKMKHPAMFPKMLVSRLIEIFSSPDDLVLDPFAGSGSTLIASYNLDRPSIGIEISSDFVKLTKNRLNQYNLEHNLEPEGSKYCYPVIINDDSTNLEKHVKPESVSLCVTSPPYWNILGQKRTADHKKLRNYGNLKKDLSLIESYQDFIISLGDIFEQVYKVLKKDGYAVINVMDIRKGPVFYPFHMDLSSELTRRGYLLDDIIIWDRRKEYNNLRPLGYPYVFRVNKVHEFLLVFQKKDSI